MASHAPVSADRPAPSVAAAPLAPSSLARLSPATASSWRGLVSARMLWMAWLPVVTIGLFHYGTGSHHFWAHDVLRRLYYLPILFAAFSQGLRGGLAVALVVAATYVPHAFFMGHHLAYDPATTLNKILEIVLYLVIGGVSGLLADREAQRRREVENAMASQERMADQLVRAGRLAALGELVAGIAHEIRNPLHTIKGTAEIVDEAIAKDADEAPMWELLRQEVDRLEGIAERFLSFARPRDPALEPQTLHEVYARIGELLKARVYESPGVSLDLGPLDEALAATVLRVDRDQLTQVILNIASNALRAMAGEGTLRLSADLRDGDRDDAPSTVAISLENDGPAIPQEQLERIFDPFWTRSGDGTGLGLPIAERIAEAHGGTIEVENTGRERGVAFRVILPHGG